MEEPHQRVQSGKLRKSSKQKNDDSSTKKIYEKRIVYIGIENATKLLPLDLEDEYATYLQTPTILSNSQVELIGRIALNYGISSTDEIDRDWRRTWNIGAWHIGNKLSISINLKQPNISNCWINISNVDIDRVQQLATKYSSERLSKSTCKVVVGNKKVQIQGRWALNIADDLLLENLITRENIEISSINIGQTRLFCWIVANTGSKYICFLTKDSIDIIIRYIPEWCMDMSEANSGGSTTLKLRSPPIVNDSTQLSISELGWLQYQGRSENIGRLSKALSMALQSTITSIHLKLFLESLEYKILDLEGDTIVKN